MNARFKKLGVAAYDHFSCAQVQGIHADCFEWLASVPEHSIHAIVTDPPYGVKEYDIDQIEKMNAGQGGVWRIPPSFDGNLRSPLPRFTALNDKEREQIRRFFYEWAKLTVRAVAPGGHLFVASNTFLSQLVFNAMTDGGLEYRGMLIRTVRTMRGGDRPKNAEEEFSGVCSMPRGCYEPWGIFRSPMPKAMTVSDCLREFGTGGLRRKPNGNPFEDLMDSERTSQHERSIADHPSLKPQSLLRKLVYASLPLGKGIVADPFMGSGSTIAAAKAIGYQAIGIERYKDYFELARNSVPKLAALTTREDQLMLSL